MCLGEFITTCESTKQSNAQRSKMKPKLLIHVTMILSFQYVISIPISTPNLCGKIEIRPPFLNDMKQRRQQQSSKYPNEILLSRMLLCKSHKLYLRTSLGLFPISSIDYNTKLVTITSHSNLYSTQNFISPSLLTAGFPSPSQPNSLILVNCTSIPNKFSVVHNCNIKGSSCLLVEDSENLHADFNPTDLNCSHYMRVYRGSTSDLKSNDGYEMGTRISYEIPDHIPNICDECQKPNGDCGVGLRCVCHARECRDNIVNKAGSMNPAGGVILSTVACLLAMISV